MRAPLPAVVPFPSRGDITSLPAALALSVVAGAMAARIDPKYALAALLAAVSAWALTTRYGSIVVVAPAFLVVQLPSFGPIEPALLMALLILASSVAYWATGAGQPPLPRMALAAIGVIGVVAVLLAFSGAYDVQLAVAPPLLWAAGFVLAACLAADRSALLALSLAVVPLALLAVAETAGFPNPWPALTGSQAYADLSSVEGARRAQSTFGHPLIAGGVLAVMAILMVHHPSRFRGLIALTLAAGALMTVSRSAILGIALAVVVMVLQSRGSLLRNALRIAAAAAVAWLLVNALPQLESSLTNRVGASEQQAVREYAVARVTADLRAHPESLLLGGGYGESRRLLESAGGINGFSIFDNQYVTLIYDFGLLPLAIAAALVTAALMAADRAARSFALPALATAAVVLGFADGLYWSSFGLVAAIALGLCCAQRYGLAGPDAR